MTSDTRDKLIDAALEFIGEWERLQHALGSDWRGAFNELKRAAHAARDERSTAKGRAFEGETRAGT